MCEHDTTCPTADAVDHDAAVVVAHDDKTGYSKLCNGVIRFDDGGEILPDGTVTGACRGPALHAEITADIDYKFQLAKLRSDLEQVQFDLRMSRLDGRVAVIDARMEALVRSTSDSALKAQIDAILARRKADRSNLVVATLLWTWWVCWMAALVLSIATS